MSKLIDVEAEIPLTDVQLDGIVVSKIMKHATESTAQNANGLLLGLDLDGTLEVSNCFALPTHVSDEDDKASKSMARYQTSMLRSLKEVQGDDGVVGFYQATTMGAFFNQTLIETQVANQERLRHGGVVVVHDLTQAARGVAAFRAFRLTPTFLDAYKKHNFSSSGLATRRLTFSTILEEIPLKIRTNPLLSAFVNTLTKAKATKSSDASPEASVSSALPPSFSALDLAPTGLTRNLEQIIDTVDAYRTEEGNLAYMSRQIAREKAKADAYVSKRKDENASRVAQGLPPLPEEDVSRLFKIPAEPNRLDSMLLLGQLDSYGQSLGGTARTGLVKMYGAKASASP